MSCSKELFFPEEARISIRHTLKHISVLQDKARAGVRSEPDLSAPVRLGPLEFRTAVNLTPRSSSQVSVSLQCRSHARGFPWSGCVAAEVRILDGSGNLVLGGVEAFDRTIPVSCDIANVGEGKSFSMMKQGYVIRDSIFLEVRFKVNDVKIGKGNSDWKIPIPFAFLNTAPPPGTLPDPDFGEMTLVSKEELKFPVHRWILEWSSPVFRTMLSNEMREKVEGVVKMGFGSKVVRILIKFLYNGGFKEEMEGLEEYGVEDFLEVVNLGGMYELPLLMKLAGVALLLRCNSENVLELLSCLKKYGEPMRETMISLTDFLQKNIHDMALE